MADNVISKIKLPDNQEYILKDSDAARSNHTHTTTLEKDTSGTSQLTLAAGTKYKLTTGETSYIFTTPADANNKVTIAADTTTNANYPLVFGSTNTSTTTAKTEGLQKSTTKFYVNPSTGNIQATTFNGITLAAAAAKSITDNSSNADVTSSDTNLITGRTLYYQLAKKGYTTNTGTVTNVATGAGLTGGPIATTGTIKANLTSDDKLANAAADGTETAGRVYPVRLDKDGKLAVNVPWMDRTYTQFTGNPTSNQTPAFGSTFTIQQISQATTGQVSGTDRTVTIPGTIAANNTKGLIKPWYNHTKSSTGPTAGSDATAVAVNAISNTAGKYYAVEIDSDGRLFANIPWTGTVTSITPGNGLLNGTGTGAITTSGTLNINYGTNASEINGGNGAAGTANTVSRSDHVHKITVKEGTNNGEISIAGVTVKPKGIAALAYKASLVAGDIPDLAWSKITSGKPTTLSGYGITDAKIANGVITLGSNTITPVTSVNGHTGGVVNVTAGDLGLSSALRYVGKTTSTMSESFTGVPAGISGYTKPIVGDVVLDSAGNGEYVCIAVSGTTYTWESLGSESSFKKVQTAVSSPSAGNSAQIEFIDTISQDVQGVISATKQPIRTASKTQTGVIQITQDNANLFLNTLSVGSSAPSDNDYYISQYANGGTTTTTYHRRPVSKLYDYIKSKTDTLYPTKAGGGATGTWGIGISGNAATATKFASAQSVTLTGDASGTASSQAGWSISTVNKYITGRGRLESANIENTSYLSKFFTFLASTSMTEGKPAVDGSIAYFGWDNNGWAGELYIPNAKNGQLQFRGASNSDGTSDWEEWVTVLDTRNYTTTLDSTYLKLSGGTLTGAINTANKTWNKIGDDAQIGDINKAGHLGIKGVNGNTGIFFTTYGQTADTTGGAITWDGTKFNISSTTPIDATVASAASLTSSAAPTITKTGTSTIDLTANTTYTLTVGGQSVIFKTPADDNSHYTTHLYAGGSSATGNAEVTSGNVYIRLFDNTTHRNSIQLSPGSNMSITSNDEGVVTFTSVDKSHKSGSWNGLKYTATAVGGADELSFTLPTGTGATQVALGNHNHDSVYVKKADGVTAVTWDSTNKKITRTINGTAANVVEFVGTSPITVTGAANKLTIAHSGNSGYKHIPSGGSSGQFLGWDSDGTAKWVANPNSDTKVTLAAITSGTAYYPVVGTGTGNAQRQIDTTGFAYKGTNGTTSAVGAAELTLGNSTASGTANNKQGKLTLYGSTAYTHTLLGAPTSARTITLPDATGTVELTNHIHGNLTHDGKITSTATIANGDKLVIVDSDTTAGGKITGSTITFDGSTATKALTQKGTWETFNNYSHPTGDGNLHVPATGTTHNGQVLKAGSTAGSISWGTLSASDVGAATSGHTHATTIAEAASGDTNSLTLAFNKKYKLTTGGTNFIFTTPANPNTNTTYTIASGDSSGQIKVTPSVGDAYNVKVKDINTAAYRGVDSSIGAASTSTNLATSSAVASFVEGKGYVTSSGVTQIATGSGLTGGPITTTGTISIATGGVTNGMLAGSIANGKLANSAISIAGTSVSLGGTLSADTLRTNLGLSNALHFRGIATVAITDGSTTNPTISGYDFSKKEAGDVIIDKDSAYEYVWTTESKWERLGGDDSYKVTQTAVTKPDAVTNKWVSAIGQNTNGVINVSYTTLDTSGTWSGNAGRLTNLTTSDNASSTDTWRYVWFSYNDLVTGRPAYSNKLVYQTSTNTLKIDTGTLTATQYSGNAATATTATNLANKPSLAVSDTSKITVTAGGKTSDAFTVPYATNAGTATIANKLGTADKGSGTKPIYLAAGVPTECSTYAGGTAVTLNGASKAASTASFYAPTSAGSNTQALVGGTPTWTKISPSISIGAGTSSAAPTVNVSVLGQNGTAQSITTATTGVYGVTKLQDGVSSDSTVLAATAKAAKTASTSATHTLATTTKFFVTGCTSSTTNTAGDDFDTGVYVTTTAGEFSAVRHSYNVAGAERAYTHYNMTDQSIDFVFV